MRALNLHKARWRQLTVSLFAVFFLWRKNTALPNLQARFLDCNEKRMQFTTLCGRESGKIVEKSGPNSIRWLPKMCRFAVSRYLHNSNSWPSLAQLQRCRIILSSAFGRFCTYVQTLVLLSVKLSETWSHEFLWPSPSRRCKVQTKYPTSVYHWFLALILIYNE